MICGDFLSSLLNLTTKASLEGYQKERLIDEFSSLVEEKYQHWTPEEDSGFIHRSENLGIESADPFEISALSMLLPWGSFINVGPHRLGNAYRSSKRSHPECIPEKIVKQLNDVLPLRGLSVVESGCFEGTHSLSLAHYGAKVYAFDARIENIVKSLVKAWCFGRESSIKFDLIDIESQSVSERILNSGYFDDGVDLYHCRGVMYHLSDPAKYLKDISVLSPMYLYIHTQLARASQVDTNIETCLGRYDFYRYSEPGRHELFAGTTKYALWVTSGDLVDMLSSLGYVVAYSKEWEERHGNRGEFLFKKC